ncbi:MAG: hypothetical protein HOE90_23445 [Bacteriovoracaceae bacterium]|jgi:hypothetical protein|nr:hypothetical protein [Bacteriovoracaceae bacterium]
MKKIYILIVTLVTLALGYEFLYLNQFLTSEFSFLASMKEKGIIASDVSPSTRSGKWVSLYLGWIGSSFLLALLLYSLRRRVSVFKSLGAIKTHLDFHIFCGFMGTVLIVFHANFKVGGLVAIPFWTMMISFVSGIIGRFLMGQLSVKKEDLEKECLMIESELEQYPSVISEFVNSKKQFIQEYIGGQTASIYNEVSITKVFYNTFLGDFYLHMKLNRVLSDLPKDVAGKLKLYSLANRKLAFYAPTKKILSYWHSFHLPFSIVMYVLAILHIVSSLFFSVEM